MHEVWAIVVAAGSGTRFGDSVPKQFLELGGLRVIDWAVAAAEAACHAVVAVVPSSDLDVSLPPTVTVVAGGDSRAASVRAGLAAIPDEAAVIVVHDAARPLVTPDLIRAGLRAARACGAAVAATPVRDTLKRVRQDGGGLVEATVDRTALWAAQTPQVFRTAVLRAAFAAAGAAAGAYTDDAALVEAIGQPVRVFPGRVDNLKVTVPEDVALAEALLRGRAEAAR
jgi:2-C-methyl-D-erythritol 4-phosphate cytidylyltransferase